MAPVLQQIARCSMSCHGNRGCIGMPIGYLSFLRRQGQCICIHFCVGLSASGRVSARLPECIFPPRCGATAHIYVHFWVFLCLVLKMSPFFVIILRLYTNFNLRRLKSHRQEAPLFYITDFSGAPICEPSDRHRVGGQSRASILNS